MLSLQDLHTIIKNNIPTNHKEFTRLFHGRGGFYEGWEFLTIDSIHKVLKVALFKEIDIKEENALLDLLKLMMKYTHHDTLILQRRYLPQSPTEVLIGTLDEKNFAIENGLKYHLNLHNNRNNGFFADMKIGREFVRENAKDKKVLNLFSYTCAFSVAAIAGGAKSVVNVDMSKGALSTGRENHRINNLDHRSAQFMPYNILKSFSRIRKAGPYDLIIIDPPTFQRGSFAASKDYLKVIRRLKELSTDGALVLSALNSPELDTQFIKDIFEEYAHGFSYVRRLDNMESFKALNEERSLKNLIFTKSGHA